MRIIHGDNLEALKSLEGEHFDLVELDGPYMAGLEDWDTLTESEYIKHYAERLTSILNLIHPWSVIFVFGYPENCAEIKSWACVSGFNCRRWLTWYNQKAAHAGRFTQTILALMPHIAPSENFHRYIKNKRKEIGLSVKEAAIRVGYNNGRMYKGIYENFDGKYKPNLEHFMAIMRSLGINPAPFWGNIDYSFDGLTNIDFINVPVERAENLNDNGLRSKPIGLYIKIFKPLVQPFETRKALILYGGSGNAAIAAEALGYDTTVIERDAQRCELIKSRSEDHVKVWKEKLSQGDMFLKHIQ